MVVGWGRVPALVVLVGGAAAVLAFLVLPMVSLPPEVAALAKLAGLSGSSFTGAQLAGALAWLWVVPAIGATVAAIGVRQLCSPAASRGAWAVLVLAGASVVAHLVTLPVVASRNPLRSVSVVDLTGVGFWVTLIAMLAATVAAIVDLMTVRPVGPPAPSSTAQIGRPHV